MKLGAAATAALAAAAISGCILEEVRPVPVAVEKPSQTQQSAAPAEKDDRQSRERAERERQSKIKALSESCDIAALVKAAKGADAELGNVAADRLLAMSDPAVLAKAAELVALGDMKFDYIVLEDREPYLTPWYSVDRRDDGMRIVHVQRRVGRRTGTIRYSSQEFDDLCAKVRRECEEEKRWFLDNATQSGDGMKKQLKDALADVARSTVRAEVGKKMVEAIGDDREVLQSIAANGASRETRAAAEDRLVSLTMDDIQASSSKEWLSKVAETNANAELKSAATKRLVELRLKEVASFSSKEWLAKVAETDGHFEVKSAAEKKLVELTLSDIAASSNREWLSKVAGTDSHVEVKMAAEKRIAEIDGGLRRERDEWIAEAADRSIKAIREAHSGDEAYENPFPRKGYRADWLSKWTEPRLELSDADRSAGEARLKEFGQKFLPNAYANYEKVKDSAGDLQQVFNETFPEPWSVDKTSPKWNMLTNVLGKFAKARTEYFFCHDEICHYWLRWRLGVMDAADLAKVDSQKIAIRLLPENFDMAEVELLPSKQLDAEVSAFAAKHAPESFAVYGTLRDRLLEQEKLVKEVDAQSRQMDFVRFDRAHAAMFSMFNDIARELDGLSRDFQSWRADIRTAVKKPVDIAACDTATVLRLKPFVDSLASYIKDRAIGPVIPVADMVQIPGRRYRIQRTEVTQIQWMAVMGDNPSRFKGADRPVENVSWNDCKEFIKKLGEMDGVSYRLPTEFEWEFACRAGSRGDWGRLRTGREGTLDEMGWYGGNGTHPVAMKQPNAWGVYDMHGNVWEWCEDKAGSSSRADRGGGWDSSAMRCMAGNRSCHVPGSRDDRLGFRLAASQD